MAHTHSPMTLQFGMPKAKSQPDSTLQWTLSLGFLWYPHGVLPLQGFSTRPSLASSWNCNFPSNTPLPRSLLRFSPKLLLMSSLPYFLLLCCVYFLSSLQERFMRAGNFAYLFQCCSLKIKTVSGT